MFDPVASGRPAGRSILLGGLVAAATAALPSLALAGECPPELRGVDVRMPVALAAEGVTDTVLNSIDLANEPIMLQRPSVSSNLLLVFMSSLQREY